MTPTEFHERMTAGEIAEQEALYRFDPWGETRADWRAAAICYWLYRLCCLQAGKRAKHGVSDFLLSFGPPERQTPEALKAKVMAMNAMFGGRVKKAKPKGNPASGSSNRVAGTADSG